MLGQVQVCRHIVCGVNERQYRKRNHVAKDEKDRANVEGQIAGHFEDFKLSSLLSLLVTLTLAILQSTGFR